MIDRDDDDRPVADARVAGAPRIAAARPTSRWCPSPSEGDLPADVRGEVLLTLAWGSPNLRAGARARRALGACARHGGGPLPVRAARRPAAHLLARRERHPDRGVGARDDARLREARPRRVDPRRPTDGGSAGTSARLYGTDARLWSGSAASARPWPSARYRSACACGRFAGGRGAGGPPASRSSTRSPSWSRRPTTS